MLQAAYLSKNDTRPSTTSAPVRLASKNSMTKGCQSLSAAMGEDGVRLCFRISLFSQANDVLAEIQRIRIYFENIEEIRLK